MYTALRHTALFLAILSHLCFVVVVEYAHHHGEAAAVRGSHSLAPHDCGSNERHLAVDGSRTCAACTFSSSLVATVAIGPAAPVHGVVAATSPGPAQRRPVPPDLFHCGKRGPPAA
jgi:hypothetical protein